MKPTAQDIQDEIFQKMPQGKKLKLALEFSAFLLKLNTSARNLLDSYGFSRTIGQNRKDSK